MNADRENIRIALLSIGGGIKREGNRYFAGVAIFTGDHETGPLRAIQWRPVNDGIIDHMVAEGVLDPASIIEAEEDWR